MRRPLARSLVVSRRPGLFYGAAVQDYLDRVRAVDGAGLDRAVTNGINAYIRGLFSAGMVGTTTGTIDGVISQAASKIKAHCVMSGANTLSGCFVPVVGPAPTNFNFASPAYNRKTGLIGDGAATYLDTNRNNNADPQNSQHCSVYMTTAPTIGASLIGAGQTDVGATNVITGSGRSRNATAIAFPSVAVSGLVGISRAAAGSYTQEVNSTTATATQASDVPLSTNLLIYARRNISLNQVQLFSNARISAYTIGEALDLSVLRVLQDQLMAAFAAAIP